jgi:D-threo-aldose 1-dehydrogenase
MGIPRVDALVIHDLDAMFSGGTDAVGAGGKMDKYLDQLRDGGVKALQELKSQLKIKAFGIGFNDYKHGTREVVQEVMKMDNKILDFILLAGPYTLLDQGALDDILPLCRDEGMTVVIGAPFASGILVHGSGMKAASLDAKDAETGKRPTYLYQPASDEILEKVQRIEEVCAKFSVNLPAAALQFPLSHPRVSCVLSGVKSEAEVQAAARWIQEPIPVEFWQELRSNGLIRHEAPIPGDDISHL